MRILPLFDNAIFLRNYREGMRFPKVASAVLMTALVILLIFMGCYFNRNDSGEWDYKTKTYHHQPWLHYVFLQVAILQGVILLLFGSLSANRMAAREKNGGTLDFHRASPTSRFNQGFGLVLGGPILEWCLFFLTLFVSAGLLFITDISIKAVFIFYAGLILSAFSLHALLVLGALAGSQRLGQANAFFFMIFIWVFFPLIFSLNHSVIYHATGFPAYEYLWQEILHTDGFRGEEQVILHSFFGFRMPFLWLQILAQFPLLVFIFAGIQRKISHPERALFSKAQSAMLCGLIFFYHLGSSFSVYLSPRASWYFTMVVMHFFYLIFFLGIFGMAMATPSYLNYTKGLRRVRKLDLKALKMEDDQNSNVLWLGVYCFILTVFYFLFSLLFKGPLVLTLSCWLIFLCQTIFLASAWEYFSLSRHHQKKIYFGTAMLILWVILPVFGLVTEPLAHSSLYSKYFSVLSPPWVAPQLSEILVERAGRWKSVSPKFPVAFAVVANFGLALLAVLRAARERRRLQEDSRLPLSPPL